MVTAPTGVIPPGDVPTKRTTLLVQGVVAYQHKLDDSDHPAGLSLTPVGTYEIPEDFVLFDGFNWAHLYIHTVLKYKYHFLEPMIDIGWLFSRYSWTGYDCASDCFTADSPASGDGTASRVSFGTGLTLDLGSVELFAGIQCSAGTVVFPGYLVIRF